MLLMQATDAVLADQLQTIVRAQVTMAAVMVLCALAILGAALALLLLVRRAVKGMEDTRDQLLPHVTPILSRATTVADDVREITASARDDARAAHQVVEDLLARSRTAADALEERVRRFGLVLDLAQEEAEALLMDAAATARGVSTAARALREDAPHTPRSPAEPDEKTHTDGRERP